MKTDQKSLPRQGIYYGWVIIACALISACVLIGVRQSFGVFFKSLETEFNLSRVATSSVFSAYMVVYAVQAAVSGWALDRFGPRVVVAFMGFATGLGLLLTSQITALWQIFLTYSVIMAIGTGGSMPVPSALVSRWFVKKRGLALGITTSASGLGTLLIAPLAALLITNVGWRGSYAVLGLLALVVVIAAAMFLRRDPSEVGAMPDGEPLASRVQMVGDEVFSRPGGLTYKEAIRTRTYWLLASVWFLFAFSLGLVTTHLIPDATDKGISVIEASTLVGTMGAISILAKLVTGPLSDRIGRKALAIGSALTGTVAFIWLIPSHSLWMFYVFALLFGLAWGGTGVNIITLASDIFGRRRLGTILGTLEMSFSLGSAAGPAVGGWVFDINQSYTDAFIVAAAAMSLLCVFLLFARREARE